MTNPEAACAAVVQQLQVLNRSMEELSARILKSQAPLTVAPVDELRQACAENLVDYTDKWPRVEVSTEVRQVSNFNIFLSCFDASLKVTIDWEESEFIEGIHYYYDVRSQRLVLSEWVLDNESSFNPDIFVENAIEVEVEAQDLGCPKIWRVVQRGGSNGQTSETLWLTREYHITGTFRCDALDARHFPFDLQRLPVKVQSRLLPGLTTMGEARKVMLVDPQLRRLEALEAKGERRSSVLQRRRPNGVPAVAPNRPLAVSAVAEAKRLAEGQPAHIWAMTRGGGTSRSAGAASMQVGEMYVCGFGGGPGTSGDEYHIEVVLVRRWMKYLLRFVLLMLLVLVSVMGSVFVAFTDDMMTNRLTITLGITLVLIGFTGDRPQIVSSLPYSTLHDGFAKNMVMITVITALENWFAAVFCWGGYRDPNLDPELADTTFGEGSPFGSAICQEGLLGYSRFDSYFFIATVLTMLFLFFSMVYRGQGHQVHTLMSICDRFNKPRVEPRHRMMIHQPDGGVDGKLSAEFALSASDFDVVRVLSVNMPLLRVFPRFWAAHGRLQCWRRCCGRRTKLKSSASGVMRKVLPMGDDVLRTSTSNRVASGLDKYLGKWPRLEAGEPLYIVDVGTGELGFWRLDQRSVQEGMKALVFMEGGKVSMPKSQTFHDAFVRNTSTGYDEFVKHIQSWLDDDGPPDLQSYASMSSVAGASGRPRRRPKKILLGLTGAVRRRLEECGEDLRELEQWIIGLQDKLTQQGTPADPIFFVPTEQDEATCELVATEWLVQSGDLDVTRSHPGPHGEAFASFELNQAFMGAAQSRPTMTLDDFTRTFRDFVDSEVDVDFLTAKFQRASQQNGTVDAGCADVSSLCEVFHSSAKLMRSLVKHRLFNGTISAGGGSCQITVRAERRAQQPALMRETSSSELSSTSKMGEFIRRSEFYSLPVGNKTPLVVEKGATDAMWPSGHPATTQMVVVWRRRIQEAWDGMDVPEKMDEGLRGLYIGISAVFYAAKLAGCCEVILPKAVFLERLRSKQNELLSGPTPDPRDIANLVLVEEVVGRVLHASAWLVCKRNWMAQPADLESTDLELSQTSPAPEVAESAVSGASAITKAQLPTYAATWVLGFYLNRSNLL